MKVEPYLEIHFTPTTEPTFTLSFNTDEVSFEALDLEESDIRQIIQELTDMLELLMDVYNRGKNLSSTSTKKTDKCPHDPDYQCEYYSMDKGGCDEEPCEFMVEQKSTLFVELTDDNKIKIHDSLHRKVIENESTE